jgi:hypothetical protein
LRILTESSQSKGTLHNIRNMVEAGKPTLVYFAPAKGMYKISNQQELQDLLKLCNKEHLLRAESRIAGISPSDSNAYRFHEGYEDRFHLVAS